MANPTIADLQADIDKIKTALQELGVQGFIVPSTDTPVSDALVSNNMPPQS